MKLAVFRHRIDSRGQRIWPPEIQDFVGIIGLLDPVDSAAIGDEVAARFGAGQFSVMPDPPEAAATIMGGPTFGISIWVTETEEARVKLARTNRS